MGECGVSSDEFTLIYIYIKLKNTSKKYIVGRNKYKKNIILLSIIKINDEINAININYFLVNI